MPLSIEVVAGTDQHKQFTVFSEETRIGRGAGHQIQLNDPSWPEGSLSLQSRNGGYVLTNHLPHAVYYDGRPLAPEASRTLLDGTTLQPTGITLLRLRIVEAREQPGKGVVETSLAPKPFRGYRHLLPVLVFVFAVGLNFLPQFLDRGDNPERVAKESVEVKLILQELTRGTEFRTRQLASEAARQFDEAIYDEIFRRNFTLAHRRYQQVRDSLETLSRTSLDSRIPVLRQFVEQRLKATAG
jgi:hypothetical protein